MLKKVVLEMHLFETEQHLFDIIYIYNIHFKKQKTKKNVHVDFIYII